MRAAMQTFTSLVALSIVAAIAPAANAQEGGKLRTGLIRACRADITRLCGDARPGGGAILRCLRENRSDVSAGCREAVGDLGQARRPGIGRQREATVPAGTQVLRDVPYGSDPMQRMDIYAPKTVAGAPVIFMVHGGGWRRGSKSSPRVLENKVEYWLPKGYIFISVDNRLLPEANPLEQAQDVARALAAAQKRVAALGGNPRQFVLMGHSAGAHLVSLLSADPDLAYRFGAKPWRGVVALDSAAYDVPAIMRAPHPSLYDDAFGADPGFWRQASPRRRLTREAPPMLLVCSSLRRDSCAQAEGMKSEVGPKAEVLRVAKKHGAINADLGEPGTYTAAVDAFIRQRTR